MANTLTDADIAKLDATPKPLTDADIAKHDSAHRYTPAEVQQHFANYKPAQGSTTPPPGYGSIPDAAQTIKAEAAARPEMAKQGFRRSVTSALTSPFNLANNLDTITPQDIAEGVSSPALKATSGNYGGAIGDLAGGYAAGKFMGGPGETPASTAKSPYISNRGPVGALVKNLSDAVPIPGVELGTRIAKGYNAIRDYWKPPSPPAYKPAASNSAQQVIRTQQKPSTPTTILKDTGITPGPSPTAATNPEYIPPPPPLAAKGSEAIRQTINRQNQPDLNSHSAYQETWRDYGEPPAEATGPGPPPPAPPVETVPHEPATLSTPRQSVPTVEGHPNEQVRINQAQASGSTAAEELKNRLGGTPGEPLVIPATDTTKAGNQAHAANKAAKAAREAVDAINARLKEAGQEGRVTVEDYNKLSVKEKASATRTLKKPVKKPEPQAYGGIHVPDEPVHFKSGGMVVPDEPREPTRPGDSQDWSKLKFNRIFSAPETHTYAQKVSGGSGAPIAKRTRQLSADNRTFLNFVKTELGTHDPKESVAWVLPESNANVLAQWVSGGARNNLDLGRHSAHTSAVQRLSKVGGRVTLDQGKGPGIFIIRS